jgi:hypothetical protein
MHNFPGQIRNLNVLYGNNGTGWVNHSPHVLFHHGSWDFFPPPLCHKWDTPQLRLAGTFLGGLYEPSIGEVSWRAPVPKKPENRIVNATAYGNCCIQYKGAATVYTEYLLLDGIPEGFPTSEDCLSLNFWTPTKKSTMLHPVMIWIHGGGLNNGCSNSLWKDGAYIVKNHDDMIVVSIK